jgi:hypothetical protein
MEGSDVASTARYCTKRARGRVSDVPADGPATGAQAVQEPSGTARFPARTESAREVDAGVDAFHAIVCHVVPRAPESYTRDVYVPVGTTAEEISAYPIRVYVPSPPA